jgi:putative DNA primase/helicase
LKSIVRALGSVLKIVMRPADHAFAMTSAIWDRDPFLLGTPEGAVNLRTGHLHKADPDDFITKACSGSTVSDC